MSPTKLPLSEVDTLLPRAQPIQSLKSVLMSSWQWWLPSAAFSFLFASILMTGWPAGVVPNLSTPYTYNGDGLGISWTLQRVMEGWVFDNPRSGYPFGSNYLDYPASDTGNFLVLKALSYFVDGYPALLNLFFLLSFPVTFVVSFCVLNAFGLSRLLSVVAGMLFVFLPFHFLRLEHTLYLWYFVVPLFFYVGYLIFTNNAILILSEGGLGRHLSVICFFLVLASFSVYYALFGVIVLGVSGLGGWIRNRNIRSIVPAVWAIFLIVAGVLINVAPNLAYKWEHGKNPEIAVRGGEEAEIYGLKLMQLALPSLLHRNAHWASITRSYSDRYPLVNENSMATLGVLGITGFFLLGTLLLVKVSGGGVDERLSFFAMTVYVLFLFGTIGGLGALFSDVVSPLIRGWNRISIFVAFGSIAAVFLALQIFIRDHVATSFRSKPVLAVFFLILLFIGLYDETTPACQECANNTKAAYELDRDFVRRIEHVLPEGGAIYQLPYVPFPEVAAPYRMHTYDMVAGFIHSKTLRWSYAGMKGRAGDLFYRALAQEPIEKQLDVVRRLGFAGIYIDRRGYQDNANALIERLTTVLHQPPSFARADNEIVFFKLSQTETVNLHGLSNLQIMQTAGYVADKLGSRYPATLKDGIDFTRRNWPEFVRDVSGLSGWEPWGRWSDSNIAPKVRIDFFSPLPTKFTLVLTVVPFALNGGNELIIRLGDREYKAQLKEGENQVRVPIDLISERPSFIEFAPPHSASPAQLGLSTDNRKLGIGLIRLSFE